MKIYGIVMEANPFHNGHQYFINKIKKQFNADIIIAITSTSFTMRGDISVMDKFSKTKELLNNNVDIVLELPFNNAVQSADYFSKNAIASLSKIGINHLAFGTENISIEFYEKCYNCIKNYKTITNKLSQKQSISLWLESNNFSIEEISIFNQPNFTLSFQYYKYIKDNNLDIIITPIERVGNNYHDTIVTSNLASATSLRTLLNENKDISNYIPNKNYIYINENQALNNLLLLLKNEFYIKNINSMNNVLFNEGIINYIRNNGNFNNTYNDLVYSLKNKKYSISRLNRVFLHSLINSNEAIDQETYYLRLLGVSNQGLEYIKTLSKNIKDLIFSSPNEIMSLNNNIKKNLEIELKATKLYGILTNNHTLDQKEYQLPIRKEKI